MSDPLSRRWKRLIRHLRRNHPLPGKIRIIYYKARPGIEAWAAYKSQSRVFTIAIRKNQSWGSRVDAVLHEWAHCMAWTPRAYHGYRWGIAYSRLYRSMEAANWCK
jgi:hypothetical protein